MRLDPLGDFGFDGRREHRLSALAKDLGQHVRGLVDGNETVVVVTSCMVAYSWGNRVLNNQIQTQVRRLLQLLIHNFWLYLPAQPYKIEQQRSTTKTRHWERSGSTAGFMKWMATKPRR